MYVHIHTYIHTHDTHELRRSVDQLGSVSVSVSVNQFVSHVYLLYSFLHIYVLFRYTFTNIHIIYTHDTQELRRSVDQLV